MSVGTAMVCTVGLFLPATAALAKTTHKAAVAASTPSVYNPVTPVRVMDTRTSSGGGPVAAGTSINVPLGNGLPSGVTGAALNVTAVDATAPGFLNVYPSGGANNGTSVVNFNPGPANCNTLDCVVPNLVVTQVSNNAVTVYNGAAGTVDVVVDLEGYFTAAPAGTGTNSSGTNSANSAGTATTNTGSNSGTTGGTPLVGAGQYFALTPSRLADTRCGDTPPGAGSTCSSEGIPSNNRALSTLSSDQTAVVQVTGNGQVPPGAEAAVVQLTATNTTAGGYLTAFPTGSNAPTASNVNFVAGQRTSTRAIVPLSPTGQLSVFNFNGSADVVVDVTGYFSGNSSTATGGSLYVPESPTRIADTRASSGAITHTGRNGAIGPNQSETFAVTGLGNIPTEVGGNPSAALLNITEATASLDSYLTVTPSPITPPAMTSDLNFAQGEIRANADVATLDTGGNISIYNFQGTTDVALDSFGYFTAANTGPGTTTSGTNTSGTNTSGTNTSGTNTSGTNTSGTNTSGTNTSGTNTSGTNTSNTAGGQLGKPPVAAIAPVLTSASIISNGFNQSAQSIVQFVFSGPVTPNTVADFSLLGYDTLRDTGGNVASQAISANQDGANANAIDVTFPSTVDVASYTVAAAANTGNANNMGAGSAVVGTSGADAGLNNPLGTVALGGSNGPRSTTTGNTTAPDLISAAVNPSNPFQIVYQFDKPVRNVNNAGNFGFYNAAGIPAAVGGTLDGTFLPGSVFVPIDFPNTPGNAPATAVRFDVQDGSVTGNATATNQNGGSSGVNPLGGVPLANGTTNGAGNTTAPDLTSITAVGGNSTQYDFHFDSNITTVGPAGNFLLYLNDATAIAGVTVVNQLNSTTVRVEFAPSLTQANIGNVVLGAVRMGAVTNGVTGLPNTIGSGPISGIVTNGQLTDGPQLVSATVNVAARTVTYTFNAGSSGLSAAFTSGNGAGFFVINSGGAPSFADAGNATVQGNTVVVTFPNSSALANAVGAGVTSSSNNGAEAGVNIDTIDNSDGFANAPGTVAVTNVTG